MNTSKLSNYENEFKQLNSFKDKIKFLIRLFDEFRSKASMALDISVEWSEEAEEDFEELGDFLYEKMESLQDDVSA